LAHVALLVLFVFVRFVDGDEGFYLTAAQQVSHGKLLYHDFFFPQMPLLPSVQSFVAGHGFSSFYLTRLLGIIPAILSLLLFVRIVTSLVKDRRAAMLTAGLYAFSGLILAWHAPAKTYAWTDLFLLTVFWSMVRLEATKRQFWLIISAVALALAINFRLVMAAAIIPYGYCLWRVRKSIRVIPLLAALAGAVVVSIPTIRLFFLSPDQFYFGNLGFHLMRDPSLTFWSAMLQRLKTVTKLAINPQSWVIGAALLLTLRARKGVSSFREYVRAYLHTPSGTAILFAVTIALVYLIPAPIHQQYFVQAVPFFILASLPTFGRIASSKQVFVRWKNAFVVRVASVAYLTVLVLYLIYYLHPLLEGLRPYAVSNVSALCRFVHEYPATGPALSEWAGVPVLSGREWLHDLDFVGFDYPLPISDSLKRHYHLPVNDDLKQALRERRPTLYVVWNAPDIPLQAVADSNYVIVNSFDKFVVYARKDR